MRKFLKERQVLLLTWFTGLVLLLQVLNLHSYVVRGVDHQAIVAANDDDAAWNIAKTVKTRWWKDNGWVLYGPFYFRINHSIQYLWGRTADPARVSDHEIWEGTAHHAVMTTSLLALVGVSLLVGSAFLPLWWMRFLFAFGLNSAFLSNPSWAEMVTRAHPDHLFAFVLVAALWLTAMMFARPSEDVWRRFSACVWGFSVSVKMTLTLCAPGFLLLFVPPWRERQRWLAGVRYLGWMLLGYFLIGFPQTIVLDRPFRDLAMMNGLNVAPTAVSVRHWFELYFQQLWGPLLVLFLAALCFSRREAWNLRDGWWRLTAFAGLPFLILLTRNMLQPWDHYPIPFIAMLLLVLGFWLTRLRFSFERWQCVRAGGFFAVVLAVWGSTPGTMQIELEKRLHCREEARVVYQQLLKFYDSGERVWVDPYVPYLTTADKQRMEMSWEKTWSGFASGQWTVLALNTAFRHKFSDGDEPSKYTQADNPAWKEIREFYLAFQNDQSAQTPAGVFKRVYVNSCGHEIWRKE